VPARGDKRDQEHGKESERERFLGVAGVAHAAAAATSSMELVHGLGRGLSMVQPPDPSREAMKLQ
jgi:hypothetical protein